jgi:hypothetical protein
MPIEAQNFFPVETFWCGYSSGSVKKKFQIFTALPAHIKVMPVHF